jgi:hypothetical protein
MTVNGDNPAPESPPPNRPSALLSVRTLVIVAAAVTVGVMAGLAAGPAPGILAGLTVAGTLHVLVSP